MTNAFHQGVALEYRACLSFCFPSVSWWQTVGFRIWKSCAFGKNAATPVYWLQTFLPGFRSGSMMCSFPGQICLKKTSD